MSECNLYAGNSAPADISRCRKSQEVETYMFSSPKPLGIKSYRHEGRKVKFRESRYKTMQANFSDLPVKACTMQGF